MSKHGNVSTSLARRASSPSLSVGRRGEWVRDLFVLTHTRCLGLELMYSRQVNIVSCIEEANAVSPSDNARRRDEAAAEGHQRQRVASKTRAPDTRFNHCGCCMYSPHIVLLLYHSC